MLDAAKIRNNLTKENIIDICCNLQGFGEEYDSQGNPLFCTSLDHPDGDSIKLCYYDSTKLFRCYTTGDSYDIFELVKRALGLTDFVDAFKYVVNYFHIVDDQPDNIELIDDWDIFQSIKDHKKKENLEDMQVFPENILEYFQKGTPIEWIRDGISAKVMDYYGIRIDTALLKIIIPQRDIDGQLIGIRGRSFDPIEVQEGKKYMPVCIEDTWYKCPSGRHLYGIYQNKKAITDAKKIIIFESEKSVMQLATFKGIENCIGVATCGSSISREQIEMIIKLGVTEVTLAYDREFLGGRAADDTREYEKKLRKVIQPLTQYFNTYVIMDYDHLTGYKDSPTDKGEEIFDKLYSQRKYVGTIDEIDLLRR